MNLFTTFAGRSGAVAETPPTETATASLSFSAVDDSEIETGFRIETRISGSGDPWRMDADIQALSGSGQTFNRTLELYDANTVYDWRIIAYNEDGDSGVYGPYSVVTSPDIAPSGLTALAASAHQISLEWEPGNPLDGYIIYRGEGAGPLTELARVSAVTTTYAATGLDPSEGYTFAVAAYNDNSTNNTTDAKTSTVSATAHTLAALVSAAISADGTEMVLTFTDSVTAGNAGAVGVTANFSGGAVTAAYQSGLGTPAITFALSRDIYSSETGTVSYAPETNGMKDSRNLPLEAFSSVAVGNNSALTDYLLVDDFEISTHPSRTSEYGVTPLYNTAPAPLAGSFSGGTSSDFGTYIYSLPEAVSEIYGFFLMYLPSLTNASVFSLHGSGTSAGVSLRSAETRITHGSVETNTASENEAGRAAVWFRYKAATSGSNGILELWANLNSTSEVKGSLLFSSTSGNGGAINTFKLTAGYNTNPCVFDKVRLSTTPIGSNPI